MNKENVKKKLTNLLKFSTEDLEKLEVFHEELLIYNKKYNLISRSTEKDIWHRHILDSAQLIKYINFQDKKSLSDMGTGAGFPGIILAIFNKNPQFHVKLFEKSIIKCNFLDKIRSKIDVNFEIFEDYRNEEIDSNYVVSRAFKKLEEIIRISREMIKVNHKLIILKGKNAENEINKLKPLPNISYKIEDSITDPESKILVMEVKKDE
jgi:16S rRNA (guanine527-N7)-methyltransferase|tara:strand:- start:264 stop:887 length:624 start_codon:yes stop_codon:yes gene_type:complete